MKECVKCLKSNQIAIDVYDNLENSFTNILSDFLNIRKENANIYPGILEENSRPNNVETNLQVGNTAEMNIKFKQLRKELFDFSKENIESIYKFLKFFGKLQIDVQKEIYVKYSVGNIFHFKIFLIFFSELQLIAENENLFNSFDMIIAVKDLMEKYKYKLAFIHSEYLLFRLFFISSIISFIIKLIILIIYYPHPNKIIIIKIIL